MRVLLYTSDLSGVGGKILEEIDRLVPQEKIEIYQTTQTLSRRLCQPRFNLAVAIVITSNMKELQDILSFRELFQDLRIILILPDRKKMTVSMGHLLLPRFLDYMDGDFKKITAVLKRMFQCLNVLKNKEPITS
jgi:hypothetical protein